MFAVVILGGQQFKVHEKDELEVEKLDLEPGKNLKVSEVLLISDEEGKDLKLGMPYVPGAHVECQVLSHGKDEKVRVFKFKSKKRYHKTRGHRQAYTLLKVLKISSVEKKASISAPKLAPKPVAKKLKSVKS